MKIVTIRQKEQGGNTTIVEQNDNEQKEIYNEDYSNSIVILGDLNNQALKNRNIYSKHDKGNTIVLKGEDGTIINLVDFTNDYLIKTVDEKLLNSFKKYVDEIKDQSCANIYITASKNRMNFGTTSTSPTTRDGLCYVLELELDENDELTDISKEMIKYFYEKELLTWLNIFLYNENESGLKVCYDDKVLVVNSKISKYIKDDVEKLQQIYLEDLDKLNEEEKQWRI